MGMEEERSTEMARLGLGVATSSARWNPTREQICVLESLYRQGVRTPSANQIQQLTSWLRAYGQIEGKNVFYWFQNHKARQRQKQKLEQESSLYLNGILRNGPVQPGVLSSAPPCTNVICSQLCLPGYSRGYHEQLQKVMLRGDFKGTESIRERDDGEDHACEDQSQHPAAQSDEDIDSSYETLQLFPLHPTGLSNETSSLPTPTLPSHGLSFSSQIVRQEDCTESGNCIPFDSFRTPSDIG